MKLRYDFRDDFSLEGVAFDGLTGREYVTSTKDALNVMKVRNPAEGFNQDIKAGLYDNIPDEDYEQIFDTIKCVEGLWRCPGESKDSGRKHEMNILMLLVNAIELISRQDVQLRKYRELQG